MNLKNLTKGERFVVDWQYDMAGSFKESLAETIIRADSYNASMLALGFPDEVTAMYNYLNTDGWWAKVQAKLNEEVTV